MAEIAIGIDLGTSNSCVSVSQGGKVEVLPNAYGEYTTASVVAFREDGTITVGNAARANIIHDPKRTVHSSKRLIGRYFFSEEVKKAQAIYSYELAEGENHGIRVKVAEELFTLPEIGAMVLREMKSIAESRLGQVVDKAVITVPAYFNDNQRQATKDAGRIAGLEVLRILNEPTAAALAYGFGKGLQQRVAVWDLGGGTFDISVLEIGDDLFEVLATAGDTFLGGDDFDDRLIDLLADEFSAREGINLRNDPYALEKLKLAAESAKKALSEDTEVEIRIPDVIKGSDGKPRSLERSVSAEEYASLVNDLVLRTFKVCDEALQQAGVVARDLDGVILVGGPTRLPLVRDAVREYFQRDPHTDVDPDQVVAMGAAIHAASLVQTDQEAFLLDVTPLSLRIGVIGGLAEPVIERNTPVPIEQTRTFTTAKDNQASVEIRVYQGESQEAAENELLGQFSFADFQKGRRGEVEIDVTFEINTDGIVNVTARDRATGKQASTRITLSSGLSEGQIRTIIEEARTDRVKTTAQESGGVLGQVSLEQVALPTPDLLEVDARADELLDDGDDDVLEGGDDDLLDEDVELVPLDEVAPVREAPAATPEASAAATPAVTPAEEPITDEMNVYPEVQLDEADLVPDDEDVDDSQLDALTRTVDLIEEDVAPAPTATSELAETDPDCVEVEPSGSGDKATLFGDVGTDLADGVPAEGSDPEGDERP